MRPNLLRLSTLLVYAAVAVMVLTLLVLLIVGGPSLIWYVRTSLLEVFSLAAAATASWFFFMRLIHRVDYPPHMLTSMVVFVGSLVLFLGVSLGTRHLLQYPQYGETYGPAEGPGLPLTNVL